MFEQLMFSFIFRMAHEGYRLYKIVNILYEDNKDYHSDIEHLVHILNENEIILEEFDFIVLNHVKRRSVA